MTQTFDIRFARSAGLAALLEVPGNVFRWKGGGHLRIDPHGISIGVRRGFLALLGGKRTQRIPTEQLRAVYREGDALRLEFQSGKSARVVLPFWARDRETAAKIVRLLPTAQTLEIEEATRHTKPRADWRMLMLLGAAFVILVLGTWAAFQQTRSQASAAPGLERNSIDVALPVPVETANTSASKGGEPAQAVSSSKSSARREAPAFPLNAPLSSLQSGQPSVERSGTSSQSSALQPTRTSDASSSAESDVAAGSSSVSTARPRSDGVVPYARGTPAYAAAQRQLDLFLDESLTLQRYFSDARYQVGDQRFDKIEELWWKVSNRVSNSPDLQDPALRPLQELELAISRSWRRAFALYKDPGLLTVADAEVEFAQTLESRARELVN